MKRWWVLGMVVLTVLALRGMATTTGFAAPAGEYPETRRVSVANDGTQANALSARGRVSADGRFVAFESAADNLVGNDTNGFIDVFVYDIENRTIERVSLNNDDTAGDSDSQNPRLSADGNVVVFETRSPNFGSENGILDVYIRDRATGTLVMVSHTPDGSPSTGDSAYADISDDGQTLVFESASNNLVANDENELRDIFWYDRATDTVSRIMGETESNGISFGARLSADGQWVVFTSSASNLVPNDTNGVDDVFVWERATEAITRVSVYNNGTEGTLGSGGGVLSADGRYVVFNTGSVLIPSDVNTKSDVYRYDRTTGVVELVSRRANGTLSNADVLGAAVSANGQLITFMSRSNTLVSGDSNTKVDVFRKDMETGNLERWSLTTDGTQSNGHSRWPDISADGRTITFESEATNLSGDPDTNAVQDIFFRRLSLTPPPTQTPTATATSTPTATAPATVTPTPTITPTSAPLTHTAYIPVVAVRHPWTHGAYVENLTAYANGATAGGGISADGSLVLLSSRATNLVPDFYSRVPADDFYLMDLRNGAINWLTRPQDQCTEYTAFDTINGHFSLDTNWIAFSTRQDSVVPGECNGHSDVFLYDRASAEMLLVSKGRDGGVYLGGNEDSYSGFVSGDGRWVAFQSEASNIIPPTTPSGNLVYLYDRVSDSVTLVSRDASGYFNGYSNVKGLSADGRYVYFESNARSMGNEGWDAFIWDRETTSIFRIPILPSGSESIYAVVVEDITPDGRYVLLKTEINGIVPNNEDNALDLFVYDRELNTFTLIDIGIDDNPSNRVTGYLSANGRYLAYNVQMPLSSNGTVRSTVYRYDLITGEQLIVNSGDDVYGYNTLPDVHGITADGQSVLYSSGIDNIVDKRDTFLWHHAR